jgi:hypothetical protein
MAQVVVEVWGNDLLPVTEVELLRFPLGPVNKVGSLKKIQVCTTTCT